MSSDRDGRRRLDRRPRLDGRRLADRAVVIGAPRLRELPALDTISSGARTGSDAIHPGYGFLARARAAERRRRRGCVRRAAGAVIATAGDKLAARALAQHAGLPVSPAAR